MYMFVKGKEIEQLQNRAIRYFLGVHKFAANAAIVGDMGWLQPKYSRYLQVFRFWNRLLSMNNNRLTKKVFLWDYRQNTLNWNREILTIFDKVEMSDFHRDLVQCDMNTASENVYQLIP